MGVLMIFVFSVIDFIIDKFFGISFYDYIGEAIYIVCFILLMVANIIFVYTKNQYREIISHYEGQSDEKHKKNSRLLLNIIIILFLLVLLTPFFR
jgi:Na+/H+ antiporter NhaD/arsenite permease-like protein